MSTRDPATPAVQAGAPGSETLVAVSDLTVRFESATTAPAVRGVSLSIRPGHIVGVAGESGSGKTATALAMMGLLPRGTVTGGSVRYRDQELLGLREKEMRAVRGRRMAMVFQETVTALNPVLRIEEQLAMAVRAHARCTKRELQDTIRRSLADVQLTDADRVLSSYPHELSGGMCQRVMIAMALACGSEVLIADEPTTALDVSVQHDVLAMLRELVATRHLGVLFISHDLAVINELCDELYVFYRGEVVEYGLARQVIERPAHPYTAALLACLPRLRGEHVRMPDMTGADLMSAQGSGCRFRSRCEFAQAQCESHPDLLELGAELPGRLSRCWRAGTVAGLAPQTEEASGQRVGTAPGGDA
jgi:peptide/nickel transport system ATP-binding protein